ncbi:hypothetical protein HJG60_010435 [Phyllostomus discolor]|uniref:Uncharacterized protein n=1 Tax=Phyllostomus discolor TaxID=89673 RepID=A0A834AP97_9CHIR|nr:hypothetical protein HJG60_010435 [Phyllostomus discolor]
MKWGELVMEPHFSTAGRAEPQGHRLVHCPVKGPHVHSRSISCTLLSLKNFSGLQCLLLQRPNKWVANQRRSCLLSCWRARPRHCADHTCRGDSAPALPAPPAPSPQSTRSVSRGGSRAEGHHTGGEPVSLRARVGHREPSHPRPSSQWIPGAPGAPRASVLKTRVRLPLDTCPRRWWAAVHRLSSHLSIPPRL